MVTWCNENLRDAMAWKLEKLPMNVKSDEAAKMYDAAVRQLVAWSDCEQLGGLTGTLQRMNEADPDFLMGRVFSLGLVANRDRRPLCWEDCRQFDEKLSKLIIDVETLGNSREKQHARALEYLCKGRTQSALTEWNKILAEYPNDLMALKFAQDVYIFNAGNKYGQLSNIESVINKWNQSSPGYSYLHGMYAFSLEEYGNYAKAKKHAKLALSLDPKDCWATHALAHCYEMCAEYEVGLKFMQENENDWKSGNLLACHNYWHTALFQMENGDLQAAVDIFDSEIMERSRSPRANSFQLVDAASLLQRLQIAGLEPGRERWRALVPISEANLESHSLAFVDAHIHMGLSSLANAGTDECQAKSLLKRQEKSLKNFVKDGQGDNARIAREVGNQLCEGIASFNADKYAEAFDQIYPLRTSIYQIAGSDAQRDVFTQLLINAGFQAGDEERKRKAFEVLEERENLFPNSAYAKEMVQKHKQNGHAANGH